MEKNVMIILNGGDLENNCSTFLRDMFVQLLLLPELHFIVIGVLKFFGNLCGITSEFFLYAQVVNNWAREEMLLGNTHYLTNLMILFHRLGRTVKPKAL